MIKLHVTARSECIVRLHVVHISKHCFNLKTDVFYLSPHACVSRTQGFNVDMSRDAFSLFKHQTLYDSLLQALLNQPQDEAREKCV